MVALSRQPPIRRPGAAPGLSPVLHLVGLVLMAAAGFMLAPLLVDLHAGDPDWRGFAVGAALSGSLGALLARSTRGSLESGLTLRQAFVLTPLSWLAVAAVSAIPLYLSSHGAVGGNLSNAVFEAVSGITTTGATVISDLDDAPQSVLLWRALLQWMGGIGIIASAIAILPALGIGGMQLFRTESSDRSEKALPRVRQIALRIGLVYIVFTALAALVYWLLGMPAFDAVAHALTSVSTGGFSTADASFGQWHGTAIQWSAIAFMLAGAVPFVLYVRVIAGDSRALWDRQVKTLALGLAIVVAALAAYLVASGQYALEPALRNAAFHTVSIVTTTGYAGTDYGLWGNGVLGLFFALTFIGGCTGSTSGGIKIFRFEIMAIVIRTHFSKLLHPNGVFPRFYAGRPVDDEVVGSVVAFFAVFFLCYMTLTVALMGFGLDVLTSASGAVTALANVGQGLGPVIGPSGTFAPLPDGAKWLLSAAMLLGRLELFTILVLFVPRFWRG